jgi:MraZ protein
VQGEFFQVDSTLDEKGRLLLPARLRKKLAAAGIDTLYFLYYPGMGLYGFTFEEWQKQVMSRIQGKDAFDPEVLSYVHGVLAGATSVEVDGQGRLLIPPKLRTKAGIEREVVMHGVVDRLEVWNPQRWADREASSEASVASIHAKPSSGKGA